MILPNKEKKAWVKQDKNREWIIITATIRVIINSLDIPLFLIIKEKYILKDLVKLIGRSRAILIISNTD